MGIRKKIGICLLVICFIVSTTACSAYPDAALSQDGFVSDRTDDGAEAFATTSSSATATSTEGTTTATTTITTTTTSTTITTTTTTTEATFTTTTTTSTRVTTTTTLLTPTKTTAAAVMVWIPTNGGKRYHCKASCSNMIDPEYVTLAEAEQLGFTPCGRCY